MRSTMPNPSVGDVSVGPENLLPTCNVPPHANSLTWNWSSVRPTNDPPLAPRRVALRRAVPPASIGIPTVRETARAIETALARSGYPLHGVRCRCDGDALILAGRTTCYFHVQVALTLAM